MGYYYTFSGIPKLKETGNSSFWQGCRTTGTLTLETGMKHGSASVESLAISYKGKYAFTRGLKNPTSYVFNPKQSIHTKTHNQVFVVILLTKAQH